MPQLIFTKLPQLEDDWLRVALYVVATGQTDEAAIARALHLCRAPKGPRGPCVLEGRGPAGDGRHPRPGGRYFRRARAHAPYRARNRARGQADPPSASWCRSASAFWGGVIPQGTPTFWPRCTWRTACPSTLFCWAWPISPRWEAQRAVHERALLGWQAEGIDTAEAAEATCPAGAARENEAAVAGVFGPGKRQVHQAGKNMIAAWFEEYGYGREMIAEALAEAGEHRTVRYVNGILRAWYTKGHRTVRDVMAESAGTMRNFQPASPAPKARFRPACGACPNLKKNGGAGHDE